MAGLAGLPKLLCLDLSHNAIACIEPAQLPDGIKYLRVSGAWLCCVCH